MQLLFCYFQMSLSEMNGAKRLLLNKANVALNGENCLSLSLQGSDLEQSNGNIFSINISRINEAGDSSMAVSELLTLGTKLIVTDKKLTVSNMMESMKRMLKWDGVFQVKSSGCSESAVIYYELCAGSERGLTDRIFCIDLKTQSNFTLPIWDATEKIHVVIRASLSINSDTKLVNFVV